MAVPIIFTLTRVGSCLHHCIQGLVYRELAAGSGDEPGAFDTVLVHYTGTLANGAKFDSSYDRGEPLSFKVGQVIKGWQEGLLLSTSARLDPSTTWSHLNALKCLALLALSTLADPEVAGPRQCVSEARLF